MGKWIHRLSDVNRETREGQCAHCGFVRLEVSGGIYRCYYSAKYGSENSMVRQKPDVCELCYRSKTLLFDHDHNTGEFRGWLCKRCNNILGSIDDDIEILERMIDYIKVGSPRTAADQHLLKPNLTA